MIHWTQTKLVMMPEQRGNCYATTIACILNMRPELVPNVETFFELKEESAKDLWWDVLQAWLKEQGYQLLFPEDLSLFHGLCKNQLAEAKESFPQFADKFYM